MQEPCQLCHALIGAGCFKLERVLLSLSNIVHFLCFFFSNQWWTLIEMYMYKFINIMPFTKFRYRVFIVWQTKSKHYYPKHAFQI